MSTDVLLIVPPFASITRPPLGVGVLQAALRSHQITSKVLFSNIDYSQRIGPALYELLSELNVRLLIGEWLFSSAMYGLADQYPELDQFVSNDFYEKLKEIRNGIPKFISEQSEKVLSFDPKFVGISSMFQQNMSALALAREIKLVAPEVKVCLGGANCEANMGKALFDKFHFLDYVFSGEAEEAFPELVKINFNSTSSTERTFIDCGPVTSFYSPDYSDFFENVKLSGLDLSLSIPFETSRGCWWATKRKCKFCGLNSSNAHYRTKNNDLIITELISQYEKHEVTNFSATDNVIVPSKAIDFIRTLRAKKFDFRYFFEVRPDILPSDLEELAELGMVWVQAGIESLSQQVLKKINKGVSVLQNIQFLKHCEELGINVSWNFLHDFPSDTTTDYETVTSIIDLIEHLQPPNGYYTCRIDRFSDYFDMALDGRLMVKPIPAYERIYQNCDQYEISEMAYFFDLMQPDASLSDINVVVNEAVVNWKASYTSDSPANLAMIKIGNSSIIKDTRQIASCGYRVLGEHETKILEDATTVVNFEDLATKHPEQLLRNLLEYNYLMCIDEQVISLVLGCVKKTFPHSDYPGGRLNTSTEESIPILTLVK
ncbi:RiPP maturation radical SAM C-methyltransferase [Geomonas oryzae]|uniref:RiPP maturation radical SAM C-methyltransferase n=1 Tax=Geomonas oryzae TaxID=2364273 RepID=UPI0013A5C86D|nr:RiPP maturation radical SAM C-methyltransferase [Geomonas oryzae]